MSATALFYVIVYFSGLLKALMGRPIYGLYVYIFAFYFHAPTQWWGEALPEFRWSLVAAVITLISLMLNPPKNGYRFWCYAENRFLSVFTVFVLLQGFWVISFGVHTEYMLLMPKFLLFIFLVQNIIKTPKDVRGFLWANLLGGAYLAYLNMSLHTGGRMEGTGGAGQLDANLAAQYFSVLLFLGGYMLLNKFNKSHLPLALCVATILMAFFLTQSRAGIIAVVATGILALFFVPNGSRPKLMWLGFLAAVAMAILMGPELIKRFEGMESGDDGKMKDNSAASRMVIVKAQVQMLEQSPLIGHGHRGTLILSPFFVEKRYQTITEGGASLRASHNVVMAFLVDHGIFGALLYFAAITRCGWRIFAYRQLPIDETDLPRQEKHRELSNLLVGAVLGLFCFMIGGLGSNNKKLEADIWLLALIPVIHRQIKENNQGGSLDVIKQHTKKNKPPLVGLLSAEAPKSSLSGILR